jgi:guanine nucleotide-binding protein subunit alpha
METLVGFDSIINNPRFMQTSMILMLCNVTEFKEKLLQSPLQNYFPDYGGGFDVNSAKNYLLRRFMELNRAPLNLYHHFIDTSDVANLGLVFEDVRDKTLRDSEGALLVDAA